MEQKKRTACHKNCDKEMDKGRAAMRGGYDVTPLPLAIMLNCREDVNSILTQDQLCSLIKRI
jgi:hypothetical protein